MSTWFVYNNAAVREAIQHATREQREHQAKDAANPNDDRTLPGLRAELADARAEIRDLRGERERLRRRLQRDHGEQIDAIGQRELLDRLRALEDETKQLQSALRTTTDELATPRRELEQARDERDGAQLALRQTIRSVPDPV